MENTEDLERSKIVEIAKTFLRTPYHHMGRVKGAGVDCLTLLVEVYREAGLIPKIDLPYYPKDWHMNRSEERYLKGLLQYAVETDEKKPGNIIIWKYGRCYSHAAIIIDYPIFIHAYSGHGCVLENIDNAQFLTKIGQEDRPYKIFSFWK